jgi:hypothetical protein
MERAWWSAGAAARLPVMPIHSAMSSRFPLLEGVPSIQALMEDPQYAQVRAEFGSGARADRRDAPRVGRDRALAEITASRQRRRKPKAGAGLADGVARV